MTAVSTAASAAPFNTQPSDGVGAFPTLPGSMQRSQVSDLLRELRQALGLSGATLEALLRIIDKTRPKDWTAEADEPVCYAAQTTLAQDLGLTPRQMRTHERRLIGLGLIDDRRRANGSRSAHGLCGLCLTPLIEQIPMFLGLRDRLRADRSQTEALVAQRSVLYRKVKERIMALQVAGVTDPELVEDVALFLDWCPSRHLRSLSLEDLVSHVADARELLDRLEERSPNPQETSGRAEVHFRPHIQDTTEETSVICNAPAYERTSGKPEDVTSFGSPPIGGESRDRKCESSDRAHNPSWVETLTPGQLRDLATDDFRLYLDHETGYGRRQPRMIDFTMAAVRLLPDLGINHSAWDEAAERMGDDLATLCVLVIDANRNHPVTPIRRPGGTLRAMTRRYAAGDLNLVGSLIGLQNRKRDMEG